MTPARYAVAKVEIYTTTYCPFCTRAKSLLKSKNIAFVEIDVTEDDALRAKMIELSGGRRSVPEIFINGKIIGGFDELKALNDAGKLDGLLAESARRPELSTVRTAETPRRRPVSEHKERVAV